MSSPADQQRGEAPAETAAKADRPPTPRRRVRRAVLSAYGEPMVWLTGGALVICLAMILGLLALVIWQGVGTFWPGPVFRIRTYEGVELLGPVTRDEWYEPTEAELQEDLAKLPPEAAEQARDLIAAHDGKAHRVLVRVGNYEITEKHFAWVKSHMIREQTADPWAVVVERLEWGRFYGRPEAYAFVHWVDAWRAAMDRREPPDVQRAEARRAAERIAREIDLPEDARIEYLVERRVGSQKFQALVTPEAAEEADLVLGVAEVLRSRPAAWDKYRALHGEVRDLYHDRRELESDDIGEVNATLERARLDLKDAELKHDPPVAWVNTYEELKRARRQARYAIRDAGRFVDLVAERYGKDSDRYAQALETAAADKAAATKRVEEIEADLAEVEKHFGEPPPGYLEALEESERIEKEAKAEFDEIMARIEDLDRRMARHQVDFSTAQDRDKLIGLSGIVRAYRANELSFAEQAGVYLGRWWEFLTADPREANQEGGVWPAIVGTITMTLIMSIAVVPFGVLAALYLREYAKAGFIVSVVRIAINNLAGVPSIVFGVFGLGFFCYLVGAYIDGGPANIQVEPWPPLKWWLVLSGAVVVGVAAFFVGLAGVVRPGSRPSFGRRLLGRVSIALWVVLTVVVVLLLVRTPYFDGLFRARLADNEPTLGTDGLLWASLTLALLTLPVVIVATEEALSAVPNSMREGSYACGASKWQTIKRIVLPRAMPGIMTGLVLAVARGAGEVAPLMLVGAEKLAPALPVDGEFPFVHLDRTFMHLGFHIYDLALQSPNAEAAKPMVFSTTLLLITIVAMLNVAAVLLRIRLRKKFLTAQF
jgi:ABC-type phosphate transport system permease subunit